MREVDHFFFFNDTATTEIYTLSLHDALPIWLALVDGLALPRHHLLPAVRADLLRRLGRGDEAAAAYAEALARSEEHTSELQSRQYLVCRLLLEKKKKTNNHAIHH